MKGRIIGWSIVVFIALSVAGFFGIRSIIRKNKVAPFKERISEYTKLGIPDLKGTVEAGAAPNGAVKGKLITVDIGENEIDYIYFDLPESVIAKTPDEVGAIVLLRWERVQKEGYFYGTAGSKPAFYQICRVAVWDKESKQLLRSQTFRGGEPPSTIKSSQSEGVGPKPSTEVVNFLSKLN